MRHALIVDDHAESRYLLCVLLSGHGYEVEEACHGAEALERARQTPPDLVISDLLMPVMDGYMLLRQWKADETLRMAPFIVYSATYTEPKDERLARDLGADEFIRKPADPEVFMQRVSAVLDRADAGAMAAPRAPSPDDQGALKVYNEVLVRKLEHKALALEAANAKLRASELHYRALFEANPQPMWVYDLETLRFLAVNDAALAHYGWSRDEFLAMTIAETRPPEDVSPPLANVAQVADDALDDAVLGRHRRRDGSLIDVEISSHTIDFMGRRAELVLAHDVTARLRAERELARRNRLYAMLLRTNELLVRVADRQTLLKGICRIAVDYGGFRFAWVGLIDADGTVEPVARAGDDRGYVAALQPSLSAGGEQAAGPTVLALRRGEYVVSNDFRADPLTRPQHAMAAQAGIGAAAALPLRQGGTTIGSLSLYAAEVGFFGSEELATLNGMAADVSFGLDVLARRQSLQAATQVVEASPVVLFRWRADPGWPVEFVSNNVARWGYTAQEFTDGGRHYAELVHPADLPLLEQALDRCLREASHEFIQAYRIYTADGATRWVEVSAHVERDANGGAHRIQGTVTDITERHAAEQALQESEQTLRRILETLHVGVWLADATGRIVLNNAAGQRIWAGARYVGIEQFGEYKGWWADSGRPIGVHEWAAARAIERGETSIDEVIDIECFDGSRKTILNSAVPLRDAAGAIRGAIIVNHDISERRTTELALAASERRFHATFEQAAVGMAHVAPDGRWFEVNRRFCDIVGYSRAELLSQRFQDITHPDDLDRDLVLLGRILAGELATHTLEKRFWHKGGGIVWVELTVSLVHKADGSPDYFVTVIEDITSRKQAAEQLRKLSQAVEQSAESIVITDAAGAIEYVNDSFVEISGYRREELLGRNPRVLQSGRTPKATYEQMWRELIAGRAWTGEFINRRKDGTEYVEAAAITPLRQPDGTVTHYVAVKEDITERRRIEQELERYRHELEDLVRQRTLQLEEARRQAEAANQAKSAFLANMSHEIRTPMNGVLGMLDVLARSRLSDDQRELLRTARDSGRTLLGIINDILDFSKIEAGRLEIERMPVAVADVVEELCDSLVPVASRKDVDLRVFVAPQIPEQVLTDPLRLRQILLNLVGNAIKFSGGQPGRRGLVTLRATPAPGTPLALRFAVSDNGIGMAPDVVERLFTPFTQAEASTTRRFGGSGLGLTISKRLASLMGGSITVDSEAGAGSTFVATLPCPAVDAPTTRPRPDLSGIVCLVIESADLDIDGLCAYLEHAGARVRRVATAAEGAKFAASEPGTVVAIRQTGHAHPTRTERLRGGRDVRHLYITRGRRRRARIESPDVVTLDGVALRRDALLRAVAVAAGRASPDVIDEEAAMVVQEHVTPPTVEEARDRGELILVAEDDEVNRKVIRRQLQLLGRTAELANDGAEALRMWQAGRYGLVLTDLHMPEMDGYALTVAIREQEADRAAGRTDPQRVPIVALTANALRGEADHAKSIGMDDYLTKPLQLDELRRTLDRWLKSPGARAAASDRPPDEADADAPAMDIAVLARLVGEDEAMMREYLSSFRSTAGALRDQLHAACAAHDPNTVRTLAHQLKSAARSIGAPALVDLCIGLETAGAEQDLVAANACLPMFDRALQRVEAAIDAHLKTNPN